MKNRKIQSKRLYEYLEDQGVLGADQKAIEIAKKQYRKDYKNDWVKQQRRIRKEIRFHLENKSLSLIRAYCKEQSTTPTTLARDLLVAHCSNKSFQPNSKDLQLAYQQLGLVINNLNKQTSKSEMKHRLIDIEDLLSSILQP